jgi:hypothetical protein
MKTTIKNAALPILIGLLLSSLSVTLLMGAGNQEPGWKNSLDGFQIEDGRLILTASSVKGNPVLVFRFVPGE